MLFRSVSQSRYLGVVVLPEALIEANLVKRDTFYTVSPNIETVLRLFQIPALVRTKNLEKAMKYQEVYLKLLPQTNSIEKFFLSVCRTKLVFEVNKLICEGNFDPLEKRFYLMQKKMLLAIIRNNPLAIFSILFRLIDLFWQSFGAPKAANLFIYSDGDKVSLIKKAVKRLEQTNFVTYSHVQTADERMRIKKWVLIQRARGLWCSVGKRRTIFGALMRVKTIFLKTPISENELMKKLRESIYSRGKILYREDK